MLNSISRHAGRCDFARCAASLAADDKDDIKDSIKKLATALKDGDARLEKIRG